MRSKLLLLLLSAIASSFAQSQPTDMKSVYRCPLYEGQYKYVNSPCNEHSTTIEFEVVDPIQKINSSLLEMHGNTEVASYSTDSEDSCQIVQNIKTSNLRQSTTLNLREIEIINLQGNFKPGSLMAKCLKGDNCIEERAIDMESGNETLRKDSYFHFNVLASSEFWIDSVGASLMLWIGRCKTS